MVARWRERVRAAERAELGPSPLDPLFDLAAAVRRRVSRRLVIGLGAFAVLLLVLAVVLAVCVVVFWPEIAPLVRTFTGDGGG